MGFFCKVSSHMPVTCRYCSLVMETLCLHLQAMPYLQPELGYLRAGLLTHGLRHALLLHLGSLFKRVMFFKSLKNKWNQKWRGQRRQDAKEVNSEGCEIVFSINNWC